MALNLSGTSGITGAGIGTIGPSGANVTGVVTCTSVVSSGAISGTTGSFTGDLTLTAGSLLVSADNTDAIKLGASADLLLYHDGSNSKIKNVNTGRLHIENAAGVIRTNTDSGFYIQSADGNTEHARVDSSGANIAGVCTAKTFVPTEGQLSNRNIIINGAMQVAQRGTTSGTEGYSTIDRFSNEEGSCDEVPTQSQHALTSSDTGPWAEGFRHSFHIQNGNQTSGAQAANFIKLTYQVEAQDMAQSGWNYTSTSSYITLSFWVKSSVAQNFYGRLTTHDGTAQNYPFETGSLSANTWTKITKTIPGNANISINNDNGAGLGVEWMTYRGGNTTSSGVALDTWAAYASGTRTPDQTSTWFTTNDATFEVTGVQLEVGSAATPFEHRGYGEELARCQRYYYLHGPNDNSITYSIVGTGMIGQNASTTTAKILVYLPVVMRTTPSVSVDVGSNQFKNDAGGTTADSTFGAIWSDASHSQAVWCDFAGGSSSNGTATMVYKRGSGGGILGFSAEF